MILRFCPVPVSAMRACLTQGRSVPLAGERRMQELSALAPAIRVISILSGSPIAD